LGIVALSLFVFPVRGRRYRFLAALGACSVIVAALGCGGGSTTVGGGGITQAPAVPTSIAITLANNKVPQNGSISATATVTSSHPLTGTITFSDAIGSTILPITNGSAQTQITLSLVGIDQIKAQYSGDSLNLPSASAPMTAIVTGNASVIVTGTTGPLSHSAAVTVTIQ
jgi:hypothetical protein